MQCSVKWNRRAFFFKYKSLLTTASVLFCHRNVFVECDLHASSLFHDQTPGYSAYVALKKPRLRYKCTIGHHNTIFLIKATVLSAGIIFVQHLKVEAKKLTPCLLTSNRFPPDLDPSWLRQQWTMHTAYIQTSRSSNSAFGLDLNCLTLR